MLLTALYEDETHKSYYAGIIAEPPSVRNTFRSVGCDLTTASHTINLTQYFTCQCCSNCHFRPSCK